MSPEAEQLQVGADRITVLVKSEESPGGIFAAEVLMPAGGGPPMMHRHAPGEVYRVEEGEFAFYLGRCDGSVERRVAREGETVHIRGAQSHTIRNESERDARAFVVYSPGAPMERFVRAAAELAGSGPPDPALVSGVARRHGIEVTGPLPQKASA
jgi:mannose-6-phosphate isomerase-like protein (cupin superfamily)